MCKQEFRLGAHRVVLVQVLLMIAVFLSPAAQAQTVTAIQGPAAALPGAVVTFRLMASQIQQKPDAWYQGYNPDRYTGNNYVSSSTLSLQPKPDGSVDVTAPAAGRYQILARLGGSTYTAHLLVRPPSPATGLRGFQLFAFNEVDRTYATEVISTLRLTNSNAAHLTVTGCMDIDAGSFSVREWTGQSWCAGTPIADFGWLVDELHRQGLAVFMSVAMFARYKGVAGELQTFLPTLTHAQVIEAFAGYADWSVKVSKLAAQHAAEHLIVGDNWQIYDPAVSAPVNAQWKTLLTQIRGAFAGKLYFGNLDPCSVAFDFQHWSLVDGVHFIPAYNASKTGCTFPAPVGIFNLHTEEMLPYIRDFESREGFSVLRQLGLPSVWTDLYAANADGMNSLGAAIFTTRSGVFSPGNLPVTTQDNQEDVDLFEATMRSAVPDAQAAGFFLWDAHLFSPHAGGSSGADFIQSDSLRQPAMLAAATNWFGGDPTVFAPCWTDAPGGLLFSQNFEITSCPLSRLEILATQTLPVAKNAAVVVDSQQPANHVLRMPGSSGAYSIIGGPSWTDYQVSAKVRSVGGPQGTSSFTFRVGGPGYNAYFLTLQASSVSLTKNVQGQQARGLAQAPLPAIANGKWREVKLTAAGPIITVIVDGTTAIQYTDRDNPLLAGTIVLGACCTSDTGTAAEFDDITVTRPADPGPRRVDAVVSAATGQGGPVAPGEIVVIYGSGFGPPALVKGSAQNGKFPTSLAGTTVLFDNTPAPIIYAAPGQIAAVVPYRSAGRSAALQIQSAGLSTSIFPVPVAPTQPGMFSVDTSGVGPGAILNQDFTLNQSSNPAVRGGVLLVYGTGEGQTSPPGTDGLLADPALPKPTAPVSVLIGGVPAKVLYAGASPGQVAGLFQMNVEVPANAPTGDRVPVLVIVGSYISQSGLTASIR